ncbi:OLC1v1028083C1 [Oldenlandia corymbosa var. corymbosa]|uniref:Tetratricopeptide repeat protein 38 n=1 Tax=Oldenlandia corymbosa var. corymbosa TaxID=529605 RepID=A0AAV1CDA8_OLDCO|nr:OLC1v1028083C1 [Oldenlandia corymbosa var. corymbosa]
MEGVTLDKWGYEVKTSSDACIAAINSYYDQVLGYGRKRDVILEAPKADPRCVLGNILAASFICSSDPARTPQFLDASKKYLENGSGYEKAVFDVVSYFIHPDRDDDLAVDMHSKHLKNYPKDLLSLKRIQVLCFYMGRPDLSLQLVEQVLPLNKQASFIYGMLAFQLLELGRMLDAEKAAKEGIQINKEDAWSQHALCHVYQYECRFKEAIEFMEECSSSWSFLSSFMYTHNWWHVALCYLEGHSPIEKVREVYDTHVWKELERSDATPAEVYLNALGLLLRIYVRGQIKVFEDCLSILANCLQDQSVWYLEWHLDVLIVWTLTYAGEISRAEDLLSGLRSRLSLMPDKKRRLMQQGMLLAEALHEYGKGENEKALKLLGLEFDVMNFKVIGASDEQLDVFNEVWLALLINTGQATKAIQTIEKQLEKRDGAPFLWRLLEKSYQMLERPEAASAGEKARELEAAYFP